MPDKEELTYEDSKELLTKVKSIIKELNEIKAQASLSDDIKVLPKPEIKSAFEHLRSVLEYTTQDVHEKLAKIHLAAQRTFKLPRNGYIYFPYGYDGKKENFIKSIELFLPHLEHYLNDIYQLYEALQPHKTKDLWLLHLCRSTNNVKHKRGVKQVKSGTTILGNNSIEFDSATGNVSFDDCITGSKSFSGSMKLENGKAIENTIRGSISIEYSATFKIPDIDVDIVTFLENSLETIENFVEAVYSKL